MKKQTYAKIKGLPRGKIGKKLPNINLDIKDYKATMRSGAKGIDIKIEKKKKGLFDF